MVNATLLIQNYIAIVLKHCLWVVKVCHCDMRSCILDALYSLDRGRIGSFNSIVASYLLACVMLGHGDAIFLQGAIIL